MNTGTIMPGGAIRWQLVGQVAHLTLSRTAKRNALRIADWHDFAVALDQLADAGARSLVVCSADRGIFCAGSDLSQLAELAENPEGRVPFAIAMDNVMRRLSDGPMVTVAAVAGPCHGAGVAIAMACNMRVAEPTAVFAIPPARFGISYPGGDIERLVGLVGPGHAARLLYCAETIDAAEAQRIGLVEIVAPSALKRAEALAEMAAANSAESIALLKRALSAEMVDPAQDGQFIEGFGNADFRRQIAGRSD